MHHGHESYEPCLINACSMQCGRSSSINGKFHHILGKFDGSHGKFHYNYGKFDDSYGKFHYHYGKFLYNLVNFPYNHRKFHYNLGKFITIIKILIAVMENSFDYGNFVWIGCSWWRSMGISTLSLGNPALELR